MPADNVLPMPRVERYPDTLQSMPRALVRNILLDEIRRDPNDRVRQAVNHVLDGAAAGDIDFIRLLFDRVDGKATQMIEAKVEGAAPLLSMIDLRGLSDADLAAARAVLERAVVHQGERAHTFDAVATRVVEGGGHPHGAEGVGTGNTPPPSPNPDTPLP